MTKLMVILLLSMMGGLSLTAVAEDNKIYHPLYEVDIPYDQSTKGTALTDYMYAHHSKTIEETLKRWEAFAHAYLDKPGLEIDDLTALTLFRQAAYELARLYYLLGNVKMGDELNLPQFNGHF